MLAAVPLLGWGPEGHSLVARIAMTQLTPVARARLAEILGPEQTIESVASWADSVRPSRRETAPWHYVDIPIDRNRLDMARDCARDDCIVGQIEAMKRRLGAPDTTPERRREALMFLIHFIGDLHEPLHCADHDDRGGNTVRVLFFDRETNLHTVWDSGLISHMAPADELFAELSREALRNAGKWDEGTVVDWAEESHRVAQKIVYGLLPKVADGGAVPLGAAYEQKADPVVKEQLAKAGARLAAVLNAALR